MSFFTCLVPGLGWPESRARLVLWTGHLHTCGLCSLVGPDGAGRGSRPFAQCGRGTSTFHFCSPLSAERLESPPRFHRRGHQPHVSTDGVSRNLWPSSSNHEEPQIENVSQQLKGRNNPNAHPGMTGETKCVLSMQCGFFQHQKKGHLDTCCSVDESQGLALSEISLSQRTSMNPLIFF